MKIRIRIPARTSKLTATGIVLAAGVLYLAFLTLCVLAGAALMHPLYALGGVVIGWF